MSAFEIARLALEVLLLAYFAGGLTNRVKQLERRPRDTEERLAGLEAKVDLIVSLLMDGEPRRPARIGRRRDSDAA